MGSVALLKDQQHISFNLNNYIIAKKKKKNWVLNVNKLSGFPPTVFNQELSVHSSVSPL